MTLSLLVLYALLGGVECFVLYKREGKSKVVMIYLGLFLIVMVLCILTLFGLIERNLSFAVKFW